MSSITEQGFLDCVKSHKINVLMDNGVYRHIRFKAPDTGNQYFDLITYPEFLVYSGDMGCFVFTRLHDMFNFFRGDGINPGYWHEKLEAHDRMDGSEEFDVDTFHSIVRESANQQIDDMGIDVEKADEIREELEDAIGGVENEYEARKVASDFDMHGVNFPDFWEYSLERFTYRYLWACHAIQWGIGQYDASREGGAA